MKKIVQKKALVLKYIFKKQVYAVQDLDCSVPFAK